MITTASPSTSYATEQSPHERLAILRANPFVSFYWTPRALAFCLLLVVICYASSLTNAFILDDVLIVAANEQIRTIQPTHFFLQPYWGPQLNGGIYRPLTILTFSIEYSIWQAWPPGFRLVNLLLHAINGWLVFLLVRSILGSALPAWAAAAVYVVHPMQTEAVVSIVGRSELLAATFFFSAWLAFRNGRTWIAAIAYALSLLAKESAITLPAVVAVEMVLMEGGFRSIFRAWRRYAVLGSVAIAYLGLRAYVLGGVGIPSLNRYLHGALTHVQLWITSGRVFLQYFRLLLWPVEVTGDYDFNSIPIASLQDWDAWIGLVLVAACIAGALWMARKHPAVSFGILFFFVTLLPVSNWIVPIGLLMAERFLYTPTFGFALLAGMFWAGIPEQSLRKITAIGGFAFAAILCIGHNYIWQDKLTFHQNVVRVSPNNARGRLGYGFALNELGHYSDAKEQFEAGLRILPDSPPLLAGLASSVMRLDHRCDRVRPLLARALQQDPGQWQSLWVLGDCFLQEGDEGRAEQAYGRAVQITDFPDVRLLYSWGRSLELLGKQPEAIRAYERAAKIDLGDEIVSTRLKFLKR